MHTHLVNREAAVPKPRLKTTVRSARPDCQNPAWPKCVMSPPHAPDIVKTVVLAARHALGPIVNVEQDGVVLGRAGMNGSATGRLGQPDTRILQAPFKQMRESAPSPRRDDRDKFR